MLLNRHNPLLKTEFGLYRASCDSEIACKGRKVRKMSIMTSKRIYRETGHCPICHNTKEMYEQIKTLKQQRNDLLEACRNGLTTLAIISMPRLDNNVATDADLLKILAESLKAAIAKCEA